MARSSNNRTSLVNLIYHTELPTWKNMSPEHRGYRTALWRLISDNMYVVGDYYVPANELFFGTTVLADQVLEWILNHYDFNNPKEIEIIQPRYETKERYMEIKEISDYLEENPKAEMKYVVSDKFSVFITEKEEKFVVAIY